MELWTVDTSYVGRTQLGQLTIPNDPASGGEVRKWKSRTYTRTSRTGREEQQVNLRILRIRAIQDRRTCHEDITKLNHHEKPNNSRRNYTYIWDGCKDIWIYE